MPGQVLGVFDPESMRVVDALPGEDGHAQERSRTDQVLAVVGPGELGVAERNVGTTAWLFGIVGRGGSFVIRQRGSTLTWEPAGPRQAKRRRATGAVFEQPVRRTGPEAAPVLAPTAVSTSWKVD